MDEKDNTNQNNSTTQLDFQRKQKPQNNQKLLFFAKLISLLVVITIAAVIFWYTPQKTWIWTRSIVITTLIVVLLPWNHTLRLLDSRYEPLNAKPSQFVQNIRQKKKSVRILWVILSFVAQMIILSSIGILLTWIFY